MNLQKIQILEPVKHNRFRVDFSDEEGNNYDVLTAMLTDITIEYIGGELSSLGFFHNNPAEAVAHIDVSPEVADALNKLYNTKFNMKVVTLENLSDGENVISPIETLNKCTVNKAIMSRDYTSYDKNNAAPLVVTLDIKAEEYHIE